MFGRRKNRSARDAPENQADFTEDFETGDFETGDFETGDFDGEGAEEGARGEFAPEGDGPYDADDVADELAAVLGQRLDLGSVVVPIPEGAQLQVEMGQDGTPQGVHLTTQYGRISVAAYAAPKTPGQWREVVGEIADSMREQNVSVSIETGPWGRELIATSPAADMRFIGVDGYRWMVRLVAAAPPGAGVPSDGPLAEAARVVLRETIVRRGTDPHPVRAPLPVVLPPHLAEQLAAAYNQQLAAQQAAAQQATQQPAAPPAATQQTATQGGSQTTPGEVREDPASPDPAGQPQSKRRRGASGSAMQQIGRIPGDPQR